MSFVVKAVKKVFKKVKKFVKRVVKSKWFKIAAIVALSVFTAGIAAGGFAAFSGVSSVGSFFSAVGSTMATGWSAIAGSVTGMFGGGTAAGSAGATAAGVAEAGTIGAAGTGIGVEAAAASGTGVFSAASQSAALASQAGAAGGMTAANLAAGSAAAGGTVISGGTAVATNAAADAASQTFLQKVGGIFLDKGIGGTMARQGVMMGIQGYFDKKDAEKQEFYWRNRTIWGGPAFGGGTDAIEMPGVRKDNNPDSYFSEPPAIAEANKATEAKTGSYGSLFGNVAGEQPRQETPQEAATRREAYQERPLQPGESPYQHQGPQASPNKNLFRPENFGV